ncbi:MAG TPA: hypothetical protein VM619_14820 [Luteimonas sp.]|nr:hypothetical protein [Luteimonas sp.]
MYAWFGSATEARESIEWAWTFLLGLIDNGPIGLLAVGLAMLGGWLVTLRVGMLPMRCLSPTAATLIAQIAGTAASFSIVWWLWRQPLGLIVGAIVALAMPYSWALVLILLEVCPWAWARRWAAELRGEGTQLGLFGRRR